MRISLTFNPPELLLAAGPLELAISLCFCFNLKTVIWHFYVPLWVYGFFFSRAHVGSGLVSLWIMTLWPASSSIFTRCLTFSVLSSSRLCSSSSSTSHNHSSSFRTGSPFLVGRWRHHRLSPALLCQWFCFDATAPEPSPVSCSLVGRQHSCGSCLHREASSCPTDIHGQRWLKALCFFHEYLRNTNFLVDLIIGEIHYDFTIFIISGTNPHWREYQSE